MTRRFSYGDVPEAHRERRERVLKAVSEPATRKALVRALARELLRREAVARRIGRLRDPARDRSAS